MGKRHVVVVSSSDDDDGDRSRGEKSGFSKSDSMQSASRKKSKRSKKSRLSASHSPLSKASSRVPKVSFDSICDDFSEGFKGFEIIPGSGKESRKELWVDKYKPRSLLDLAVHKKKVEEVKIWFEERLKTSKEEFCNYALLITGRAGVGKSATVHVIASHLGARLCEWNTPIPTLWQEHIHNSSSGIQYASKLDEFENFVERTRKYGMLPSSYIGGSKMPAILLIDDLPLMNGKVAYGRLRRCVNVLVKSTQIPTAILITEYGKADSADNTTSYWEELQSSLENSGASKVAFNPLTVNAIKKTLSNICSKEQCNVTTEQIEQIAKASGGDIRHAITSLQYFCLRPDATLFSPFSTMTISHPEDKSNALALVDDGFSLPFGRDETLSLFHALGKFLHNKREVTYAADSGHNVILLKERFRRLPLKMDAPEKVLSQAHGQARLIADFLHENVLDFLSDEAIDDAWTVASYLSDADRLVASNSHGSIWPHTIWSKYKFESVAQPAAASVATRGVLFGNSHPLSSRWHAIRGPKLWQVEQSLARNKKEMVRWRYEAYSGLNSYDLSVMATEYKPMLRSLGVRTLEDFQAHRELVQVNKPEEDGVDQMNVDSFEGVVSEEIEDEIEEW